MLRTVRAGKAGLLATACLLSGAAVAGPIHMTTITEVRSIDGTGNNVANPDWGATETQLLRIAPAAYADGLSAPSGPSRPNAREISNAVSAQSGLLPNSFGLSNMFWQWGQFLDHDIDLTEPAGVEPLNIGVPSGDPFFDPMGTGTQRIGFSRSSFDPATGATEPRQQINQITAYIDGSNVYGSDPVTAAALREGSGGLLKTSPGDLPPLQGGMFLAGDVRANEQVGLTAMHTLWLREHNRLAGEIAASNPSLSDEDIFQKARAMVVAEMQAITYNEWLPLLLGDGLSNFAGGYDPSVNAGIANEFSTASYRFGHTMLPPEIVRLNGNFQPSGDAIALRDAFFNPSHILTGGIDTILRGLSATHAQEIDTMLIDDVRNFLFGPPGAGGFDLAALNIQRGRDHGLPGVNEVRLAYGLTPLTGFDDPRLDPIAAARLASIYGSIDEVDAWIAGLAEIPFMDAVVGELIATVLADQFWRLKIGDRFWYENIFDQSGVDWFNSITLADVLALNTNVNWLPGASAFVVGEIPVPPALPFVLLGAAAIGMSRRRRMR
ncbi:MAG: hypothetical protein Tsb0010_10140 [Parvularculaceae bacterium]